VLQQALRDAALGGREPYPVHEREQLFMHTLTLWQVFIQDRAGGVGS